MSSPRRAFFRRFAPAVSGVLAGLALAGAPVAEDEPKAPPAFPPYLKGIDLDEPAQAAFAAWPSEGLKERPYWLPWSPLSLQRAVLLNQPIFLLVTVPWSRSAQRMASEALADPLVLRTLNRDYVSLLVSADRRPDLYARYGTGNWPAISLLLPDGSPMLSQANDQGKALPISIGPTTAKNVLFNLEEGRKYFDGWQDVLHGVSQVYEKRVDLEDAKSGKVNAGAIDPVVRWLLGNVDAKNGGFGPAPKYALPGLMEWAFLREDQGRPAIIDPARNTLKAMVGSPLYDARDGGFHRMAAAVDWGGIQYEKMLESNAELIRELVFALREEDDPALREALRTTSRFVTTVLARPSQGFYLAQMADPTSPDGGGYWQAATSDPAKAPPVDKLVLSGPNALAGAALLRAGALLDDPALEKAGRAALDLVLDRAVASGRGAEHVVESDNETGRYLVTQSKVALGFEDADEATGDARYLAAAKDIATFVRNNMKVGDETAFRDHLPAGPEFGLLDMPLRPMQDNARFARVLVRLAAQGALDDGRAVAEQILGTYAGELALHGVRAIEPGLGIDELLSEPLVVTIDGPADDRRTQELRRAALNLEHGWVVIKAGKAAAPAASMTWRRNTRRVTSPSALPGQLKALIKAGRRRPVSAQSASIGLIGGSGLYALAGLSDTREVTVATPFGAPSDAIVVGSVGDTTVAFLARHGRDHRLLPSEINSRANVYAMKSLGVKRILSASAVGSMKESIHPRDVVVPDQFIDRTQRRIATFFGDGIAAHVAFADPVCPETRRVLYDAAIAAGATAHDGGTYLCMEGPAFSTRAESNLYRTWGVDVIGMTNLTEAKLAREAEICYATLALVTDYDCWHEEEADVSVTAVLENLRANAALAAATLRAAVLALPEHRAACGCGEALAQAIITPAGAITPEARTRLGVLLDKYLPR